MKLVILLGLVLIGSFIYVTNQFKETKKVAYKNDERWQQIRLKADKVVLSYINLVVGLVCVGFFVADFVLDQGTSVTIAIIHALFIAFFVLALRYPVEYCALRYFDQKM